MNTSLVVIGPTSSGKSDLAIALAQDFRGEVISADSRQVFTGMNIGSGKITKEEQALAPHFLLDVADPKDDYNISHFLTDARKAREEIIARGNLPIVCGGTGFWIQALVEDQQLPEVPPDEQLRTELTKLSVEELFAELQKKDAVRADSIDAHNKVRLIRALEIVDALGAVPQTHTVTIDEKEWCVLALTPNKELLHERIEKRLEKRLDDGMLAETQRLHDDGVSWERLENFGLEYRWTAQLLQKKVSEQEMCDGLLTDIKHYAKRQMTWLRRWERSGAQIHWLEEPAGAKGIVRNFLQK